MEVAPETSRSTTYRTNGCVRACASSKSKHTIASSKAIRPRGMGALNPAHHVYTVALTVTYGAALAVAGKLRGHYT